MAIPVADQAAAIAGYSLPAGSWRYASMIDDPDNPGAGIIKVFSSEPPEVNSDTGAMAVEIKGSYDDYEDEITDAEPGGTDLLFSVGVNGRSKAIKRVLAEFDATDATNAFRVVLERTIGAATVQFTLFALNDPTNHTDFYVESHTVVGPGDTVKVIYDSGTVGRKLR